MDDWASGIPMLRQAGFRVAALALREDAVALEAFAAELRATPGKLAILLGTEGEGLSQRWIDQADVCLRIPMHAGIDSLNVAAASAIACYALGPVSA
jgi:tRNA G18 (ribose-2'-O)-methylase SpoU